MLPEFIKKPLRSLRSKWRFFRNTHGLKTWADRQKGLENLLVILAGYKPFCYDDVFERVKAFAPSNLDICITSSGLYDPKLAKIAMNNGWSYLTTSRDCIPLPLNLAILKHPKARYIYKMDEDMFLTDGCFDVMMQTYHKVKNEGYYDVGFVAPLIPINGYGHTRVIRKLDLSELYEKKFGHMTCHAFDKIVFSLEGSRFLWGEGDNVPHLDDMNRRFRGGEISYTVCPIRFSVGFILFHRDIWEEMGMFGVPLRGHGMGAEEEQLCAYSINSSRIIAVCENTVVGHLSFGPNTDEMKKYHATHRDRFVIQKQTQVNS